MSRTFTLTISKIVGGVKQPDTGRTVTLRDLSNNILGTATETPTDSGQYQVTITEVSKYAYWYVDGNQKAGYSHNSPFWVGIYDSVSAGSISTTNLSVVAGISANAITANRLSVPDIAYTVSANRFIQNQEIATDGSSPTLGFIETISSDGFKLRYDGASDFIVSSIVSATDKDLIKIGIGTGNTRILGTLTANSVSSFTLSSGTASVALLKFGDGTTMTTAATGVGGGSTGGLVPYVGATANVVLGSKSLTANNLSGVTAYLRDGVFTDIYNLGGGYKVIHFDAGNINIGDIDLQDMPVEIVGMSNTTRLILGDGDMTYEGNSHLFNGSGGGGTTQIKISGPLTATTISSTDAILSAQSVTSRLTSIGALHNSKVPYSGATANVDLGIYSLSAETIDGISGGSSGIRDIIRVFGNANSGGTTGRILFAAGRDEEGGPGASFTPVGAIGGFLQDYSVLGASGGLIFYVAPSTAGATAEVMRMWPSGLVGVKTSLTANAITSNTISANGITALADIRSMAGITIGKNNTASVMYDGNDGAEISGINQIYEAGGDMRYSGRHSHSFMLDNDNNASNNWFGIYKDGSFSNPPIFTVSESGNVGFGVFNPSCQIHATGSISALAISSGNTKVSTLFFGDGTSMNTAAVGASSSGGLVPYQGATAGVNLATHSITAGAISATTITATASAFINGRVAIGPSFFNPFLTLHVNGGIAASGSISGQNIRRTVFTQPMTQSSSADGAIGESVWQESLSANGYQTKAIMNFDILPGDHTLRISWLQQEQAGTSTTPQSSVCAVLYSASANDLVSLCAQQFSIVGTTWTNKLFEWDVYNVVNPLAADYVGRVQLHLLLRGGAAGPNSRTGYMKRTVVEVCSYTKPGGNPGGGGGGDG